MSKENRDRCAETLLSKGFIESSFKFLSYLVASAGLLGLVRLDLHSVSISDRLSLFLLFIVVATLSFIYGAFYVFVPLLESYFGNIKILSMLMLMRGYSKKEKRLVLKSNWRPLLVFLVGYTLLFFCSQWFVSLMVLRFASS